MRFRTDDTYIIPHPPAFVNPPKNGKEHGKMKLRRFAYILAAFVLFLLVTYVIFTWGRLQ